MPPRGTSRSVSTSAARAGACVANSDEPRNWNAIAITTSAAGTSRGIRGSALHSAAAPSISRGTKYRKYPTYDMGTCTKLHTAAELTRKNAADSRAGGIASAFGGRRNHHAASTATHGVSARMAYQVVSTVADPLWSKAMKSATKAPSAHRSARPSGCRTNGTAASRSASGNTESPALLSPGIAYVTSSKRSCGVTNRPRSSAGTEPDATYGATHRPRTSTAPATNGSTSAPSVRTRAASVEPSAVHSRKTSTTTIASDGTKNCSSVFVPTSYATRLSTS